MDRHDYRFLLSEQGTLRQLIGRTSPGNAIGRLSLERRLREVEAALQSYEGCSARLDNARLVFRGRPVRGSHGIRADFGGRAIGAFAEAVTLTGSSQSQELSASGPVPHREDYQLLITATATGSFGFEIEDAAQQPALAGQSTPVAAAIAKVKSILEASTGSDEELADAIIDSDPRAVRAVRDFLETVASAGAVCALDFRNDVFKFHDNSQVARSAHRLSADNIRDDDVALNGQFLGFLPVGRRAEFLVSGAEADFLQTAIGTVIAGRVVPEVDETVAINEILQQEVHISARTRRVGSGRPRYVITGCQTPRGGATQIGE